MSWFATTVRIALAACLAALIGSIYGYPTEAAMLGLLGLVGFWLYQMQQVQSWLQNPDQPPPDAYGLWGELTARIYSQQRRHAVAQERLESSVKYLRDSFGSMRDGVVMVDEHGVIKWFNHAVEPLLGLRYPDDRGQTLTNIVRAPEFNSYFLKGDYATPLQFFLGGRAQMSLRVEITRFGAGERLLFVRNISDALKMERTRRDFVANVSHELRTPLTVIAGYLANLSDDPESFPPRYTKALDQMRQQAQRMQHLLDDLLWLSRIENGERSTAKEQLDMAGMLQELCEEFRSSHPGREIKLELATERKIYGDYRELYSAISNLLVNAMKYSPESEPIELRWALEGKQCLLQVRDYGIGIDAIHLPRLTERFYRVDDSRSSSTGGTGLGLAIVKHIAQAHGAFLRIASKMGEGSTFTLVFTPGG